MEGADTGANTGTGAANPDEFLQTLCKEVQDTLFRDAKDIKKVTVADYLKLVSLIEERRRNSEPTQKEIVVRWEDPSEEIDVSM